MRRSVRVEMRATEEEKALWTELAKPYSLSEFLRQLLLKEQARREDGKG